MDRIVRAHNENKKFRVIVSMPLMPAFEAEPDTTAGTTVRFSLRLMLDW